VVFTWPTHPNVRRNATFGLRPCQASNDICPFSAFVGQRFRTNTAVLTASPQNSAGMPFAFSMDRAMPMMV